MDIATIGVLGMVFALAAVVALMVERRMDVLYGPYIDWRETDELAGYAAELSSQNPTVV
jgi:hypothetical protein